MMTEREFQEMLHQLTQPIPQETHRAFLRAACGKDERIVKRKLSTSLILALVLIFLTTALAFAMTNGFGILDYNATQKDNDAYVGHILGIHESYENNDVSMQVNEAVFDGVSFSLTMNISHREGADPVYIIPHLLAESADGQALETDVEGSRGGNWHSGFFVPSRDPTTVDDGCYGVDVALITDSPDGESVILDTQQDAVTWQVRFSILHPEYPIVASSLPDDPNLSSQERMAAEAAWMESFAAAYRQQIIQTDGYGELVEYACSLPHEGMDEETWAMLSMEEQLLSSGAFTLVDTVEVSFTTGENSTMSAASPQVFDLGDGWQLEVQRVSATFARCDLAFLVRRQAADGKTALDYYHVDAGWRFAVLAGESPETFRAGSLFPEYRDQQPTGNLLYSLTLETGGLPQSLSLLPEYSEQLGESEFWMEAITPLTPEQEAHLLHLSLS